jgi:hypothetical protein
VTSIKGPGTPKLDWSYLEHGKIDSNELQIRTNSQIGTGTNIAKKKLNNFEKFEKKCQISALFLTQRPPDDWADALDHLPIVLVANKCTKLEKISEILLLSLGVSYMKIPLCNFLCCIGTSLESVLMNGMPIYHIFLHFIGLFVNFASVITIR